MEHMQNYCHVDYLLIVGETSHNSRVHNPIQQHGEGADGKVGIVEMPLHHAADLLIGQLHRFHGDLQRTDLLLCSTVREGVVRYSVHMHAYITAVSGTPTMGGKHFVLPDEGKVARGRAAKPLTTHINHEG